MNVESPTPSTCYPEFSEGVALVVGGSGGIGEAICYALAAAGSHVALTYHSNKEAGDRVASRVREYGRQAHVQQLDLEDAEAVAQWANDLVAQFGSIHSVVYAAGPPLSFLYIHEISPKEWARVIGADVVGCFNLVAATLPHLKSQRKGAYVALTTAALSHPPPRDILSAAPKAAIEMLMCGIAREEGRNGIRANCAAPGLIEAGLGLSTIHEGSQAYVDKMTNAIPLKRRGRAEDLADVVCFLLSDQARYVTAETINVAGGLHRV